MTKYEIKWFKDFACLCDKCPQTCCRGWVIPLSDTDCERFRGIKGKLGFRLFLATGGWTVSRFNRNSGSCPFHGRDGLCALQKEKGHDFIPWTCQSYPRFYRNYISFEESCLDLSCIGAARLFVKNRGLLDVTESEGDPHTQPCTTNDDNDYLQFLLRNRKIMTDKARTDLTGSFADDLFLYATMCQDHYSKGEGEKEPPVDFDIFCSKRADKINNRSYGFPLPSAVLKDFLGSSLCHSRLRKVNPVIYKKFRKAQALLERYGNSEAKWQESVGKYLEQEPFLKQILGYYLAYYLYQYWMRTYETYSFRRQTALGLCHVSMILLLLMASDDGAESDSEKRVSEVIAAYNRRAYFNDDILDEMYRIYEDHCKVFIRA